MAKKPVKDGKKLQIKNQTLRDLDAKATDENVRGGDKKKKASAAMIGAC